jgi:hypothetical protein
VVTNISYSSKLPSSRSIFILSLALNLPYWCCSPVFTSPPPSRAFSPQFDKLSYFFLAVHLNHIYFKHSNLCCKILLAHPMQKRDAETLYQVRRPFLEKDRWVWGHFFCRLRDVLISSTAKGYMMQAPPLFWNELTNRSGSVVSRSSIFVRSIIKKAVLTFWSATSSVYSIWHPVSFHTDRMAFARSETAIPICSIYNDFITTKVYRSLNSNKINWMLGK